MFDFLVSQSRDRSFLRSKMTTQHSVRHSVSLPLIDRLVILEQPIVECPCRSLEETPEIQFMSRDVQQFTHQLVQCEADVLALTEPVMTLNRLEGLLGIQRLRSDHLDGVMPGTSGDS